MYFSSLLFLFVFLPIVLAVYYIVPRKFRNAFLLLANLVFYGWGEPVFILIMIVSVVSNYIFGLLIEKYRDNQKRKKTFLVLSLVISLGLLAVFKYTGFVTDILRAIPPFSFMPKIKLPLPIGISFYTFQTLSYTIDVYRGDTKAQKSLVSFGTYVSFFPQLIAGPIVRYTDIAKMLDERRENISQFADGIKLFAVGLAKKVLIANQMGVLWDTIRGTSSNGIVGAWIGIISYAFQIYFDFSGYSDMACGLGKMFGFEFMKNFNYPYVSKTITEFWRRWHISLGTWFREYVYIPLGGNRKGKERTILNLMIVWFLTGLWHGASWNFVMWGMYYGILLIIEKFMIGDRLEKVPGMFRHLYSLLFVMIGWVFFFSPTLGFAWKYLGVMFGVGAKTVVDSMGIYLLITNLALFAIAAVGSTAKVHEIFGRIVYGGYKVRAVLACAIYAGMFLLSIAYLVTETYNPFLYFRF